jgi:formylglycine-generating enzyme required for sulfatase activity
MKRILVMVLGLVGALTVIAQEVKPGKVDVVDFGEGVKLEMVLIPAGKFKMGYTKKEMDDLKGNMQGNYKGVLKKVPSPKEELGFLNLIMSFQGKQHEVTLIKPFYIGIYEVTQEQWEAVMGNNPSEIKGVKLPVTNVSWEDCQNFIRKLNAKTSGGYRLPTEAEWEYACRAGTTTAYLVGDKITPKDANYVDSKIDKPVAVGSYKPNAFGLFDMHGNVFEWCEDWHGDYPAVAEINPKGAANGTRHVLRGGSFYSVVLNVRSSNRGANLPSFRNYGCGFRLTKNP